MLSITFQKSLFLANFNLSKENTYNQQKQYTNVCQNEFRNVFIFSLFLISNVIFSQIVIAFLLLTSSMFLPAVLSLPR